MKSDHLIDEIKSRLDIVDFISDRVELKKAGQNYKGLCPFHAEKTPSFMVNPSKQIFHCFGCNKGGDIVTFIMSYENMTFQESLAYLSEKAGLPAGEFRSNSRAQSSLKENLYAVQREALRIFTSGLSESEHARRYLKERGLNPETIEKFSVGYSGRDKDALLSTLRRLGFSEEVLKLSGLVHFGDKGAHDFFRDRIVFPIFDLQERVIAFGGRILSPSAYAPKYLNSPDSPIFKKGETLYALNSARHIIAQKGYSLVVEGYLDALICHQHGFGLTIAPLGTALTAGHLRKLKRFAKRVLLVFDGDAAGVSATRRALDMVFAEGMTAKILLLPQGEDPDTFVRTHGPEEFRKQMGKALSPVKFALKVHGVRKLDAVRYVLSLLSTCPDSLQREDTLNELAESSRISELTLREELKTIMGKGPSRGRASSDRAPADGRKEAGGDAYPAHAEEKILLTVALTSPEWARRIAVSLDPAHVEHPVMRGILEKMRGMITRDMPENLFMERLLQDCNGEEQGLVTSLSINPWIEPGTIDENIADCLRKIAVRGIEKQILSAQLDGDEKRLRTLLSEKSKVLLQRGS